MAEDDDYRTPHPGRRPFNSPQLSVLQQLMSVRVRPTTGPYAYGRNLYTLAQQAEANTALVNATIAGATGPVSAPWVTRKKLGKSGKLYTLSDIQNNVIRSNKAINNAKAKAAREEIRKANTTRREQARILTRDTGIAGRTTRPFSRRSSVGSNVVFEELSSAWLGRHLDADRARQLLARATNRRGAAATRALQPPRGNTNRTGDAATRRLASTVSSQPDAARIATAAKVGSPGRSALASAKKGTSTDRVARETMARTRELPRVATRARTRSGLSSLLQVSFDTPFMRGMQTRLSSLARPLARVRASAPRTSLTQAPGTAPALSFGPSLVPISGSQVGTQTAQQKCDCPKPKKSEKKKKEFACSNPIVSRSVKDGIITIKRKLQCPPSKQK